MPTYGPHQPWLGGRDNKHQSHCTTRAHRLPLMSSSGAPPSFFYSLPPFFGMPSSSSDSFPVSATSDPFAPPDLSMPPNSSLQQLNSPLSCFASTVEAPLSISADALLPSSALPFPLFPFPVSRPAFSNETYPPPPLFTASPGSSKEQYGMPGLINPGLHDGLDRFLSTSYSNPTQSSAGSEPSSSMDISNGYVWGPYHRSNFMSMEIPAPDPSHWSPFPAGILNSPEYTEKLVTTRPTVGGTSQFAHAKVGSNDSQEERRWKSTWDIAEEQRRRQNSFVTRQHRSSMDPGNPAYGASEFHAEPDYKQDSFWAAVPQGEEHQNTSLKRAASVFAEMFASSSDRNITEKPPVTVSDTLPNRFSPFCTQDSYLEVSASEVFPRQPHEYSGRGFEPYKPAPCAVNGAARPVGCSDSGTVAVKKYDLGSDFVGLKKKCWNAKDDKLRSLSPEGKEKFLTQATKEVSSNVGLTCSTASREENDPSKDASASLPYPSAGQHADAIDKMYTHGLEDYESPVAYLDYNPVLGTADETTGSQGNSTQGNNAFQAEYGIFSRQVAVPPQWTSMKTILRGTPRSTLIRSTGQDLQGSTETRTPEIGIAGSISVTSQACEEPYPAPLSFDVSESGTQSWQDYNIAQDRHENDEVWKNYSDAGGFCLAAVQIPRGTENSHLLAPATLSQAEDNEEPLVQASSHEYIYDPYAPSHWMTAESLSVAPLASSTWDRTGAPLPETSDGSTSLTSNPKADSSTVSVPLTVKLLSTDKADGSSLFPSTPPISSNGLPATSFNLEDFKGERDTLAGFGTLAHSLENLSSALLACQATSANPMMKKQIVSLENAVRNISECFLLRLSDSGMVRQSAYSGAHDSPPMSAPLKMSAQVAEADSSGSTETCAARGGITDDLESAGAAVLLSGSTVSQEDLGTSDSVLAQDQVAVPSSLLVTSLPNVTCNEILKAGPHGYTAEQTHGATGNLNCKANRHAILIDLEHGLKAKERELEAKEAEINLLSSQTQKSATLLARTGEEHLAKLRQAELLIESLRDELDIEREENKGAMHLYRVMLNEAREEAAHAAQEAYRVKIELAALKTKKAQGSLSEMVESMEEFQRIQGRAALIKARQLGKSVGSTEGISPRDDDSTELRDDEFRLCVEYPGFVMASSPPTSYEEAGGSGSPNANEDTGISPEEDEEKSIILMRAALLRGRLACAGEPDIVVSTAGEADVLKEQSVTSDEVPESLVDGSLATDQTEVQCGIKLQGAETAAEPAVALEETELKEDTVQDSASVEGELEWEYL